MDDTGIATPQAPRERWRVSKEVPLALIVSLAVYTGVAVWWARGQEARDEEHGRRIGSLERERDIVKSAERMAVIEGAITEIRRSNDRTEMLLQQVLTGQAPPAPRRPNARP